MHIARYLYLHVHTLCILHICAAMVSLQGMDILGTALEAAGWQEGSPLPMLQILGHAVPAEPLYLWDEAAYNSHVNDTAKLIHASISLSGDRAQQMERLNMPKALQDAMIQPLPVSLVEEGGTAEGSSTLVPSLADNFLPYVGDKDVFFRDLAFVEPNVQRQRTALIVAQASGSGKSRLAYLAGEKYMVGFMQVMQPNSDAKNEPWDVALSYADGCPYKAFNIFVLLLVSYFEFAADVLAQYQTLHGPAAADLKRHIVLRSLRNGKGHTGTLMLMERAYHSTKIAFEHMPARNERTKDCWRSLSRSVEHHMDGVYNGKLIKFQRDSLGLVMFVDEAQGLLSSVLRFPEETAQASTRDALFVLAAAMDTVSIAIPCKPVMCGSWLELVSHRKLPEGSIFSGLALLVCHASFITAEDMWATLQTYFKLELEEQEEVEIKQKLELLRGRPHNFFCHALRSLLRSGHKDTSLLQLLQQSLDDAADLARQYVFTLLTNLWEKSLSINVGRYDHIEARKLVALLFIAVMANSGQFDLSLNADKRAAMRHGILLHRSGSLPIDYEDSVATVNLDEEPSLKMATESFFTTKIRNDTSGDFRRQMLGLIAASLTPDIDPGRQVRDAARGFSFEHLMFSSFLLHSMSPGGHNKSLSELLKCMDLLPAGYDTAVLQSGPVNLCRAVDAQQVLKEASLQDPEIFAMLLDGRVAAGTLLYNLPTGAGADLAFCTHPSTEHPRRLVLVQLKTHKTTVLHDAVRAATPAWQFRAKVHASLSKLPSIRKLESDNKKRATPAATRERNKKTISAWKAKQRELDNTASRKKFLEIAQRHTTEMTTAIRIVLTSAPYQPKTVTAVNKLNSLPVYGDSPLCLCSISESAIGPANMEALKLASGERPVAHPQSMVELAPFNVIAHWDDICKTPLVFTEEKWRSLVDPSIDKHLELNEDAHAAWLRAIEMPHGT